VFKKGGDVIKALITGITGQDGSYLAELLLSKGYEVHGTVRRSSSINTKRIDHIFDRLHLHYADLTDSGSLFSLIASIKPNEVYNLAAQSHVKVSFELPEYTEEVVALGATRLLEAIRQLKPDTKYYQASSSEMYGDSLPLQNELTPMLPNSPYAVAKLHAYHDTRNYRNGYGIFACNGILFNHESPRRGETFVTRKITQGVARIKLGLQKELILGNLEAKRDWGYAPEYVKAIWKIMQLGKPEDIVIGTGETHTIKEFVREAFDCVKLNWKDYVKIDQKYYRPTEVNVLQADTKIAALLIDWKPKVKFKELVRIMVEADVKELGGK
jgi:GDPmannose 4,6-dehydratase